jgi:hypothetical protein
MRYAAWERHGPESQTWNLVVRESDSGGLPEVGILTSSPYGIMMLWCARP